MAMYSHSKLSTFEQCKLKYKFKYVDKIEVEVEESIESFLGRVVHSTLEWLYKIKLEEGKTATIDDVIVYFSDLWREGFSPDFLIVKSHLNDKIYFEMGVRFLLDYYMKHTPFDDGTLETEKKIIMPLDEAEKDFIIGFIDRFVHNKKLNRYEIHDYKTGNSLPSRERFEQDRQLALYSYAIKRIYGFEKEVKLIWHYLAYNQEIHSSRTNEELEELIQRIKKLIKEIENENDFSFSKSPLCDWCEYKSICPAWGNSPEDAIRRKLEREEDKIDKFPTLLKYMKE